MPPTAKQPSQKNPRPYLTAEGLVQEQDDLFKTVLLAINEVQLSMIFCLRDGIKPAHAPNPDALLMLQHFLKYAMPKGLGHGEEMRHKLTRLASLGRRIADSSPA